MASPPLDAVYRRRRPRESPLYRLIERFFPQFEHVYPDRYEKDYGPWRPITGEVARKYLRRGDPPAGDVAGLERLAQYLVRCPFSLERMVRVSDSGSVVYRAETTDCRRFPQAARADLRGGPRRNFQVFDPFDFLAEITQHIPDKGQHLLRYYGWYSPRHRGLRAKQPSGGEVRIHRPSASGAGQGQFTSGGAPRSSWAALIQRVYQVDPLTCPRCGHRMRIISFIESRQHDVIEKILRHCGLWQGPLRTLPRARPPPGATSRHEPNEPRELQLVLDPEYL